MSETEGARRAKTGERTQILNTHSRSKSYRGARTSTPFISIVCEKVVRPVNPRKTRIFGRPRGLTPETNFSNEDFLRVFGPSSSPISSIKHA